MSGLPNEPAGEPGDASNWTDHQVIAGLRGVSKSFGGTVAVDDVSFELKSGEVLALLGEIRRLILHGDEVDAGKGLRIADYKKRRAVLVGVVRAKHQRQCRHFSCVMQLSRVGCVSSSNQPS